MVKKKASGKKSSRYVSTLPPFQFDPPSILDLGYKPPEYVKCRISSSALASPLNFEWPAVPTEVSLAMIKDAICKRHGGAAMDLTLYREQVKPENKLQGEDDSATLKDLGIQGITSGKPEELPLVTILYDFRTAVADDAIVLVDGNDIHSKYGINMKMYNGMSRASQPQR